MLRACSSPPLAESIQVTVCSHRHSRYRPAKHSPIDPGLTVVIRVCNKPSKLVFGICIIPPGAIGIYLDNGGFRKLFSLLACLAFGIPFIIPNYCISQVAPDCFNYGLETGIDGFTNRQRCQDKIIRYGIRRTRSGEGQYQWR